MAKRSKKKVLLGAKKLTRTGAAGEIRALKAAGNARIRALGQLVDRKCHIVRGLILRDIPIKQ